MKLYLTAIKSLRIKDALKGKKPLKGNASTHKRTSRRPLKTKSGRTRVKYRLRLTHKAATQDHMNRGQSRERGTNLG